MGPGRWSRPPDKYATFSCRIVMTSTALSPSIRFGTATKESIQGYRCVELWKGLPAPLIPCTQHTDRPSTSSGNYLLKRKFIIRQTLKKYSRISISYQKIHYCPIVRKQPNTKNREVTKKKKKSCIKNFHFELNVLLYIYQLKSSYKVTNMATTVAVWQGTSQQNHRTIPKRLKRGEVRAVQTPPPPMPGTLQINR